MELIKMSNLEWDLVDHCFLKCINCSHQSPIKEKYFLGIDELKRDIAVMKQYVHSEQLSCLGGEPLLHPEIVTIAKIMKESGLGDRLNIDTNGVLLERMTD